MKDRTRKDVDEMACVKQELGFNFGDDEGLGSVTLGDMGELSPEELRGTRGDLLLLLGYSRPGDIVTFKTGSSSVYRFRRLDEGE